MINALRNSPDKGLKAAFPSLDLPAILCFLPV